jgi:hypothetical protein
VEDTISALRGLRRRYQLHHGVWIFDNTLAEAARAYAISACCVEGFIHLIVSSSFVPQHKFSIPLKVETTPTERTVVHND